MSLSGAVIRRAERPVDRFTIISNSFHRDMRLSFAARGLGGWLLSHADGFQITSVGIARQAGIGRDQVRRMLAELEQHGYLRRSRVRESIGQLGSMIYDVRCTPLSESSNPGMPTSCLRLANQAQADQGSADAHHKKTSSKNISTKEEQPSGGAPGGATVETPEPSEEDTVTPDPAQAQLFDVPAPEPPAAEARKLVGAQAVLAAYVEAWRDLNDGADPLRAAKGRIARDAKSMLGKREATVDELVESARAMAATPYAALGVQLNIYRRGGRGAAPVGHAPPRSADYEGWRRGAEEDAARRAQEGVSPEVAAMRARYVQAGAA